MPILFIRAVDSQFHFFDEGAEYHQPEAALASGVQSAMALAADEIAAGAQNAAIEISVEREDGTRILRSVVAVSVSTLMPVEPAIGRLEQGL